MRVLVIEDNSDIATNIGDYLEDRGHVVDFAGDGVTGLHLAVVHDFDVIVLDLTLPGMDGLDVARKLRHEAHKQTPVLMLTARDALEQKLTGFESGADDYMTKPFALQELAARLEVLARRGKGPQSRVLKVADLTYNLDTLTVTREGKSIQLNPIGLKLLQALMEASPSVVTRQDLEQRVWGEELPDSDVARAHPRFACGDRQTVRESADPHADTASVIAWSIRMQSRRKLRFRLIVSFRAVWIRPQRVVCCGVVVCAREGREPADQRELAGRCRSGDREQERSHPDQPLRSQDRCVVVERPHDLQGAACLAEPRYRRLRHARRGKDGHVRHYKLAVSRKYGWSVFSVTTSAAKTLASASSSRRWCRRRRSLSVCCRWRLALWLSRKVLKPVSELAAPA
jgi:DNA-binding response OmpR family regulator